MFYHWGKSKNFIRLHLSKTRMSQCQSWKENRKVWAHLAGQLLLCCGFCCHKLSRFYHVQLFVTFWIVACQAPVSMGFSKQEYWSGLPCPSPGDLPGPGIEPVSLISPALAGRFFTTRLPGKLLLLLLCRFSRVRLCATP